MGFMCIFCVECGWY